tara:strand:+ start:542 stop:1216 length:675 start_codon:yes stop_codon:yes gene_type:complete
MYKKYDDIFEKSEYPAKVYILAYPEPINKSGICKTVNGIKPTGEILNFSEQTTKDIDSALKKLVPKYVKETKGEYLSCVDPLAYKIGKDIGKNSNNEEMKKLLDSNGFRSLVDITDALEFSSSYDYFKTILGFGAFLALPEKEKGNNKTLHKLKKDNDPFMNVPINLLKELISLPPPYLVKTWKASQFKYEMIFNLVKLEIDANPEIKGYQILEKLGDFNEDRK